ncbi:MAG: hypothetical protein ACRCVT_13425 [Leadbetterella sp.]
MSEANVKLLDKIQKITKREGGLLVLVTTNDDVLDEISRLSPTHFLSFPTLEEGIDLIYFNDQENNSKEDGEDEEYGSEENEY